MLACTLSFPLVGLQRIKALGRRRRGPGQPSYHVTNLNDFSPGACAMPSPGKPHVVFDVADDRPVPTDRHQKCFHHDHGYLRPPHRTRHHAQKPRPHYPCNGGHDVNLCAHPHRNAAVDGIWITDAAYNVVIDTCRAQVLAIATWISRPWDARHHRSWSASQSPLVKRTTACSP